MSQSLKDLESLCPASPLSPWHEQARLIRDGWITDANARSITVGTVSGTATIEFPDGLTGGALFVFCPARHERREGAAGGRGARKPAATRLDRLGAGPGTCSEDLWFRGGLAGRDGGITWIRRDCTPIRAAVKVHRDQVPRAGVRLDVRTSVTPAWRGSGWRGCLLVYKDHEWRFRADAKNVITILSAFQANSWGPIDLSAELMEDQIRDGLHYLNSRTQGAAQVAPER